jgi:F-type H+-transporting ATPase subunit b
VGIDGFTFAAQVVNLLILLALLWRFLYKPVLRAMDSREEKIASRVAEAEAREQEAGQERDKLRRERQELETHRKEERDRIQLEAAEEKKALLKKARKEAEESRSRWFGAVEEEKSSLLEDLRHRAGKQLCACLQQALEDLANEDLQSHAIEAFLRILSRREGSEGEEIERLSGGDGSPLVVRTAWDLSEEEHERLERGIRDRLDRDMRFETDSDLICGIEIHTEAHKIGWSVRTYLEQLERHLLDVMDRQGGGAEEPEGETDAEESHEAR